MFHATITGVYTIYLDRHIDGINALTHTKQTRTHNLDAVCVTMICGDEYCHKEVAESSLAGERERGKPLWNVGALLMMFQRGLLVETIYIYRYIDIYVVDKRRMFALFSQRVCTPLCFPCVRLSYIFEHLFIYTYIFHLYTHVCMKACVF